MSKGFGISRTAWWKLDEMAGNMAADSAGANQGTLNGAAWVDENGRKGLRFNGVSDAVNLNCTGLRAVADTFTISFWADAETTRSATAEATEGISGIAGQQFALAANQFSSSSGEAGVGVSVGMNGVSVFELADNHFPSTLVADRPLAGWNHFTVVYRDKQPSLYVNGELVKTGLKSIKTVHPTFSLGGINYCWYKGKLADVRVYPRALKDGEVRQLAQGQAAAVAWTVDEGANTPGHRYALGPVRRGGGPDGGHAGVGVSVGVNGISVCEASDEYEPSLLVDDRPLSGWNHITVVYRDRQPTLYLNGVYEKAGCKSEKAVHPVFNLGGAGRDRYVGKLKDVRVYNRPLSDAEIQALAMQAMANAVK